MNKITRNKDEHRITTFMDKTMLNRDEQGTANFIIETMQKIGKHGIRITTCIINKAA